VSGRNSNRPTTEVQKRELMKAKIKGSGPADLKIDKNGIITLNLLDCVIEGGTSNYILGPCTVIIAPSAIIQWNERKTVNENF